MERLTSEPGELPARAKPAAWIGGFFGFLYSVPALLNPQLYGHWPLRPQEQAAIGHAFSEWLKTIPRKQRKAWLGMVMAYGPMFYVGSVLIGVTYPRILETRRLALALQRLAHANAAERTAMAHAYTVPNPQGNGAPQAASPAPTAPPPSGQPEGQGDRPQMSALEILRQYRIGEMP